MEKLIIAKFPPFYNRAEIKKLQKSKPDIIIFDDEFNADIKHIEFPDTTFFIDFGKSFNKLLLNITFPKYLKKIKFGDNFTQSLDFTKLPNTLEVLELGNNYNVSLFCVKLPDSLKELKLNDDFNAGMPQFLPSNLEKLYLGKTFDYSANNFVFGNNIKSLCIGGQTTNSIFFENENKFTMLEELHIKSSLNFDLDCEFPELKKLVFDNITLTNVNLLKMKKLEHLVISGNKPLNKLPQTIKYLEIIHSLDFELTNIPDDIEELYINVLEKHSFNPANFQVVNPAHAPLIPNMLNLPPIPIHNNHHMLNLPPMPIHNNNQKQYIIKEQTNLPLTLNKLKLVDSSLLKYIKIPFGTLIFDKNNNPISHN